MIESAMFTAGLLMIVMLFICRYYKNLAVRLLERNSVLDARVSNLRDEKKRWCEALQEMRDQIGKPEGTVFLPEKSYWEDWKALREENTKLAILASERKEKLVRIWNYILDNSDPDFRIGKTDNTFTTRETA